MEVTSTALEGPMLGTPLCPRFSRVLVVINALMEPVSLPWPDGTRALALHPDVADCGDVRARECAVDTAARTLTVPAQTTAVLVEPRA